MSSGRIVVMAPPRNPDSIADAYERVMARSVWTAGGCFEFHGAPLPDGYGRISVESKPRRASRVVMEHHYGPSDLMVLHSCDNPPCVNVNHLRYGTHTENVRDAVRQGRMGRKPSKLTAAQVEAIKRDTRTHSIIAAEHGVSPSYISMIRNGRRRWSA